MIKILVIDDSQSKLKALEEIFRSLSLVEGQNFIFRQNIFDAKVELKKQKFDLLILDLLLPKKLQDTPTLDAGIGLLREIYSRGNFKIPDQIIGLTAFKDAEISHQAEFKNHLSNIIFYDEINVGWKNDLYANILNISKRKNSYDTEPDDYGVDFCIICALEELELSQIIKSDFSFEKQRIRGFESIYRADLQSEEKPISVIATSLPKMGLVSAATYTTKLIQRFRPRVVCMSGICGGIKNRVNLGDAIFASPVWEWQTGKFITDSLDPNKSQFLPQIEQISVDRNLERLFKEYIENDSINRFRKLWHGSNISSDLKTLIAPIASGNAVVADENTIQNLIEPPMRKIAGIEMEIYGVYFACREEVILPPLFFAIKTVSDFSDSEKNDKVQEFSAFLSAKILTDFISNFGKNILEIKTSWV
jgi:nucleoside phosphorylase